MCACMVAPTARTCARRWPYIVIQRSGIQPLVPTQETPHALWWARQKRFTAKQVLSQYEFTARCRAPLLRGCRR